LSSLAIQLLFGMRRFTACPDSPSFSYQLKVLSQVKAQNLGFLSSIQYFVEHAEEMAAGTDLQTIIGAQSVSAAVFIISTVFVAECLTAHLLSDRLKIYLAVYFSFVRGLSSEHTADHLKSCSNVACYLIKNSR
jgi:hypothetical protein